MKKSVKITISILAVILVAVIVFDVAVIRNRPQEKEETVVSATESTTSLEDVYTDPVELQARKIIENMTIFEKVCQMLLYYIPKEEPLEKMERWQFGAYVLFSRNFENSTPEETRQEIAEYQKAAKIPAFIAVDEEGGGVNRVSQYSQYRSEPFPSGIRLYQNGGWQAVIDDSKDKSQFLSDLGINTVLAPVADVPYSRSDYIYTRAFSTDPEAVSEYITNVVTAMNEENFISCVKHFPGYGNNTNTHTGSSVDTRSWESFEERDLLPFKAAVEADVPFIMVSHNIIEDFDAGVPASLSKKMHDYIRQDMGFDGIIVCDGLGMSGVREYVGGDKGEVAVQAIIAGNDMICATDVGIQARAIVDAVNEGRIKLSQIEDSVARILMIKIKYGLIAEGDIPNEGMIGDDSDKTTTAKAEVTDNTDYEKEQDINDY
ncbi:MAG: glycoside hydrolase family 3 N-terminal domain-containing protein [Eubacteriales bacterium]|nr:glycoside hydrolase family 3 N-terminal domain-containing protein [Eubacteriales bacterium]